MKTLLLTAALTTLAGSTLASSVLAAPDVAPKSVVLTCPVTGEKIASPAAAAGHATYKGKTYYFCCSACKPDFDKNPDKVLAAAARRKGQ